MFSNHTSIHSWVLLGTYASLNVGMKPGLESGPIGANISVIGSESLVILLRGSSLHELVLVVYYDVLNVADLVALHDTDTPIYRKQDRVRVATSPGQLTR